MEKIDVVYILGHGSVWNNNELRFSLRSVQKNLKNYRKIFIIGENPEWLKGVTHVACEDPFTNNTDGNIITKVLKACEQQGLSDNFLFMNDDYLVMNPVDATKIPAYHKGDMATFDAAYFEKNFWRGKLYRTFNLLKKKGFSTWHFDGHVPIIMNKKLFPEIMSKFDYAKDIGYCMKSLYANVAYDKHSELDSTVKKMLSRPYTIKDMEELFTTCTFVSIKDSGLTLDFKKWIFSKFPAVSKFEKDTQETKQLEILHWFKESSIEMGVELYNKYGKNNNVKQYFSKHVRDLTLRKIESHLHKLI